jgi:hypothetical protein
MEPTQEQIRQEREYQKEKAQHIADHKDFCCCCMRWLDEFRK